MFPVPKPIAPLKTLQETMEDYIRNDEMRELILKMLAYIKEHNTDPKKTPNVQCRHPSGTVVDFILDRNWAHIYMDEEWFYIEYDLTHIQFATPFEYLKKDIVKNIPNIANRLL